MTIMLGHINRFAIETLHVCQVTEFPEQLPVFHGSHIVDQQYVVACYSCIRFLNLFGADRHLKHSWNISVPAGLHQIQMLCY